MNRAYPYIPNSNETVKKEMLQFVGVEQVEEIYGFLPPEVRMKVPFDLPAPFLSEMELKKHMDSILKQNISVAEMISFLGAGCYDHYVPAVCDEINGRSEFLTAYSGDTYGDHGKCQAIFEFTSMMGELLNMDVVGFPTYDGGQAAATAVLMSTRINGRHTALIPENVNPSLLKQMMCYCEGIHFIKIRSMQNGQLDLANLRENISCDTACVFVQNPNFLGFFEEQGDEIAQIAHNAGAEFIVYADPSTLGIISPPADYGADIACGDIQPLGIHMSYGSGLGGYLGTRQEEKYVMNFPHHLYNLFVNSKGQYGFARALPERTSYYVRDKGIEFLGTCVGLWAITAAVYMASMGPEGMKELGEIILYKSGYAKQKLGSLPGVKISFDENTSFMEFVLNFDGTEKTVKEINRLLLTADIQGGYDLSEVMPKLGQSMLVCVTEKTDFSDIDRLAATLSRILKNAAVTGEVVERGTVR